jgi:hypothetical protein
MVASRRARAFEGRGARAPATASGFGRLAHGRVGRPDRFGVDPPTFGRRLLAVATPPGRCPRCGQDAPVVLRGIVGYCTACGAARSPLHTTSVELAGRPARVGGSIARGVAWAVLFAGLLAAVLLVVALQTLFPAGIAGWVLGGLVALVTVVVGVTLLVGGRALERKGDEVRRATFERAAFALAATHGGTITAVDLARAIGVPANEADLLLTELAKRPDSSVDVDIDDEGRVLYRFRPLPAGGSSRRYRVADDGRTVEPIDDEQLADADASRWRGNT